MDELYLQVYLDICIVLYGKLYLSFFCDDRIGFIFVTGLEIVFSIVVCVYCLCGLRIGKMFERGRFCFDKSGCFKFFVIFSVFRIMNLLVIHRLFWNIRHFAIDTCKSSQWYFLWLLNLAGKYWKLVQLPRWFHYSPQVILFPNSMKIKDFKSKVSFNSPHTRIKHTLFQVYKSQSILDRALVSIKSKSSGDKTLVLVWYDKLLIYWSLVQSEINFERCNR